MQQTLRYTDAKSDKFWHIETLANQFVVNYGKYGTNGRYEIKEFDSPPNAKNKPPNSLPPSRKKATPPPRCPPTTSILTTKNTGSTRSPATPSSANISPTKPSITANATKKPPSAAKLYPPCD